MKEIKTVCEVCAGEKTPNYTQNTILFANV